jgi:hypothetical protein
VNSQIKALIGRLSAGLTDEFVGLSGEADGVLAVASDPQFGASIPRAKPVDRGHPG